ncbi:MAG: acyl-CoA dehydrogenase family protein [Gemmatimonadaceae bacterium]|nr:acyl-CoA dehydrogenase family protein [Gemmatimonadaceae bacterium]
MSWALIPLTEEQRAVQQTARDFARSELAPHSDRWDREAGFDREVVQQLGALGFLGMMIPEAYDGLGLDTCTYLVALEEIAAVDASVAVLMSVHNSLPTQMLLRYGTEEQRQRFLTRMARGEWLGAFALSEPEAGSDAASLRAQAVRDGDHYVLNGVKAWVSHGSMADVILCMARTDMPEERKGARGISTFILTPDMVGLSVGKKEDKMGLRGDATVQLHLDDVRVPRAHLLGEEGMGFIYAMQSLESGRLGIAAQSIGIARAALEHAVAYAAERKQFGKPIKEFQGIQFKLADMATRVTASRALLYAAAAAKDRGEPVTQFASMAKLMSTETAMWVTTQAVQVFGGYGYVKDYPVERLFRDAKVTEIYEGTSEIQRIVIARELYAKS